MKPYTIIGELGRNPELFKRLSPNLRVAILNHSVNGAFHERVAAEHVEQLCDLIDASEEVRGRAKIKDLIDMRNAAQQYNTKNDRVTLNILSHVLEIFYLGNLD
jgi:hypothetical protein